MRPIRLEFGGLQSYREPQVIDFADLLGGGLFGIFGPTGAGKSTILDAITLALYGKVERVRGTQGIMNQAENRLFVKFTFALGDARYRVERSYKRERDTQSIRVEHCRLVEIRGGAETVLADKERFVTDKVVEILGLRLDDFTRAVVLPQGQFAEFLHLSGRERTQMLQRIFSLSQYGDKLNQRLKERMDRVTEQLRSVEGEQAGLGDASAEALARAEEQLQAAEQRAAEAEAALRKVESAYRTWERVWELQQELAGVDAALQAWEARSSEAEAWRRELDGARRAEQVCPYLDGERQARRQAEEAADRLIRAEEAFRRAREAEERAVTAYEAARARRAAEAPKLTVRRSQLQHALELELALQEARQAVDKLADQVVEGKKAAAAVAHRITRGEERLTELARQEERLQGQLGAVEVDAAHRAQITEARRLLDRLREAENGLADAQRRLQARRQKAEEAQRLARQAQAHAEEARARLEECDEQLQRLEAEPPADEAELRSQEAWLSRAEEVIRAVAEAGALLERRQAEQRQRADEATRLKEKVQKAAAEEQRLREALERARDDVRKARAALDEAHRQEHAAALVRTLVPGEPCPVCGSTEHPRPAVPAVEVDLAGAQAALERAEQVVQETEKALEKAVSVLAEARSRADAAVRWEAEAAEAVAQAKSQLQAARDRLPAVWRDLDVDALPEALRREAAEQADRKKRYDAWQSSLKELRQKREDLSRTAAKAAAEASARGATLSAEERALSEAAEEVTAQSRTVAQRQEEFDRVRGEYDAAGIEAEQQRIEQADREAVRLRKKLEQLRRDRQEWDQAVAGDRRRHQELMEQVHQLEVEHAACRQRLEEVESRWRSLSGGQPAAPQLKAVEKALAELEQAEAEAQTARQQAEHDRSLAAAEQAAASELCSASQRRLREAEKALRQALAAARFTSAADAEAALRSVQRQAELEQSIAAYQQEGTMLRSRRERLTGQLGGQSLTEEEWQGWQQRLEGARAEAVQRRDERTRALQIREDLKAKRQRWEELEEQRQALATSLLYMEELKQLLRGNAFVDFLAQDQMERVAAAASVRLAQLSRERYALEVEPGGGFVIRDNGNGGLRRAVTTLSGGETFLTSLSLALALSAQIQLRGRHPLEFFFLDEGFGTLDPELLDLVISTLERLHFERLHVGVISHVPELRNRIQRRVIVTPAEPGGRGSIVTIERA